MRADPDCLAARSRQLGGTRLPTRGVGGSEPEGPVVPASGRPRPGEAAGVTRCLRLAGPWPDSAGTPGDPAAWPRPAEWQGARRASWWCLGGDGRGERRSAPGRRGRPRRRPRTVRASRHQPHVPAAPLVGGVLQPDHGADRQGVQLDGRDGDGGAPPGTGTTVCSSMRPRTSLVLMTLPRRMCRSRAPSGARPAHVHGGE